MSVYIFDPRLRIICSESCLVEDHEACKTGETNTDFRHFLVSFEKSAYGFQVQVTTVHTFSYSRVRLIIMKRLLQACRVLSSLGLVHRGPSPYDSKHLLSLIFNISCSGRSAP